MKLIKLLLAISIWASFPLGYLGLLYLLVEHGEMGAIFLLYVVPGMFVVGCIVIGLFEWAGDTLADWRISK
jgi:hypothetical protein